ncbi:SIMPL domain-containing protein [Aeromicrobium fastidiosum]|uniref:SIMPL domain-containing protein n=1 Tax=Aeromicrobium fastidiosum TaxID=52699 RepID=UPI00202379B1|nr:SIMPL domain-containing protein [Aeromicrobium fastidiosum]MCL8252975.1 SIMPL domain-containing protein [Aeromicrobium fastidiosum]
MTLDITVRGSAEQHHPAERATVSLAAAIEGSDKAQAFADALAIQDPLTGQLKELADLRAVETWSSDQVRVFSHRPWDGDGRRGPAVHVARVQVRAEFTDFERLSSFLDHWSSVDGVEVGGVVWDVSAKSRRVVEAEVRKAAVDDAVVKAQAYATAVRRGKVVAVQLADPGMLTGPGEAPAAPMAKAFALSDGQGPELDLTPAEIVVRVEVDARFQAD